MSDEPTYPNATTCAVHAERISRIEVDIRDLHRTVHGNGRPGIVDRVEARLDALEAKIARLTIVVVALSASGGAGLATVVQHLIR